MLRKRRRQNAPTVKGLECQTVIQDELARMDALPASNPNWLEVEPRQDGHTIFIGDNGQTIAPCGSTFGAFGESGIPERGHDAETALSRAAQVWGKADNIPGGGPEPF